MCTANNLQNNAMGAVRISIVMDVAPARITIVMCAFCRLLLMDVAWISANDKKCTTHGITIVIAIVCRLLKQAGATFATNPASRIGGPDNYYSNTHGAHCDA